MTHGQVDNDDDQVDEDEDESREAEEDALDHPPAPPPDVLDIAAWQGRSAWVFLHIGDHPEYQCFVIPLLTSLTLRRLPMTQCSCRCARQRSLLLFVAPGVWVNYSIWEKSW